MILAWRWNRKLFNNKYKKKIAKERKVIPDPIETCSLQIIDPQLIKQEIKGI